MATPAEMLSLWRGIPRNTPIAVDYAPPSTIPGGGGPGTQAGSTVGKDGKCADGRTPAEVSRDTAQARQGCLDQGRQWDDTDPCKPFCHGSCPEGKILHNNQCVDDPRRHGVCPDGTPKRTEQDKCLGRGVDDPSGVGGQPGPGPGFNPDMPQMPGAPPDTRYATLPGAPPLPPTHGTAPPITDTLGAPPAAASPQIGNLPGPVAPFRRRSYGDALTSPEFVQGSYDATRGTRALAEASGVRGAAPLSAATTGVRNLAGNIHSRSLGEDLGVYRVGTGAQAQNWQQAFAPQVQQGTWDLAGAGQGLQRYGIHSARDLAVQNMLQNRFFAGANLANQTYGLGLQGYGAGLQRFGLGLQAGDQDLRRYGLGLQHYGLGMQRDNELWQRWFRPWTVGQGNALGIFGMLTNPGLYGQQPGYGAPR